ncbi:hypothetical protein [Pseudomonas nitroreducens]|uniref:hypothetical protein n=1 Tax=Pseudomonas nitroreducens TaxID=46680 RepID=UPI002D7FBB17|nr:hypothetical protein [Pseudomonas nitroreducens]
MQLQTSMDNTAPRFPVAQNVAHPTMSTLEISQLTGKAHKNIIRDVRKMLAALRPRPLPPTSSASTTPT